MQELLMNVDVKPYLESNCLNQMKLLSNKFWNLNTIQ
jgi:hypothetical protein